MAHTFTDQEWDGETGLYNYGARLYDPALGRFLTADSIVPDWHNLQALDRYAYALNNPVKYVDPDGHAAFLAVPLYFAGAKLLAFGAAFTGVQLAAMPARPGWRARPIR